MNQLGEKGQEKLHQKAIAVAQTQERNKKEIEQKNLAKAQASDRAYKKTIRDNENFKKTTRSKIDMKIKNFEQRMRERENNSKNL